MDEVQVEKTPASTHTTINRTVTPSSGSGSMLWFLIGGLVVAVVVVGYFVMGEGMPKTTSSAPSDSNFSVNVETTLAPAAEQTPEPTQETAPAEVTPEPPLPVE